MGYSDVVLGDAPSLYWRLGEAPGAGAVLDSTVNNRDGTVSGATLGEAGALIGDSNTAVSFDGVDDRIVSGYSPFVNGTDRTYEWWQNRDVDTGRYVLGSDAATNYFGCYLSAGVSFILTSNQTDGATWASVFSAAGLWDHVVLVFREAGDTAELFVNGVSQGSKAHTATYGAVPGNFIAGSTTNNNNAGYNYDGFLDEVAVYEFELSSARVLAHFESRVIEEQTAIWPFNRQGPF